MVDTEEEVPKAAELTSITQDDLNEAMASLETSMTVKVKSVLKELLEGMKSTPDSCLWLNPRHRSRRPIPPRKRLKVLMFLPPMTRMGREPLPRFPLPGLWRTGPYTSH